MYDMLNDMAIACNIYINLSNVQWIPWGDAILVSDMEKYHPSLVFWNLPLFYMEKLIIILYILLLTIYIQNW